MALSKKKYTGVCMSNLETCTEDMTVDAGATFSGNRDGTCDRKEASSRCPFLLDR